MNQAICSAVLTTTYTIGIIDQCWPILNTFAVSLYYAFKVHCVITRLTIIGEMV